MLPGRVEREPVGDLVPATVETRPIRVDGSTNELASGTLHAEFSIERVTNRFVALRLRAANGGSKRVRCQIYVWAGAERRPKRQLLRLTIEPRDVVDAGVIVERSSAGNVVAEFTGAGGLSAIVSAPCPAFDVKKPAAALACTAALAGFAALAGTGHLGLRAPSFGATAPAHELAARRSAKRGLPATPAPFGLAALDLRPPGPLGIGHGRLTVAPAPGRALPAVPLAAFSQRAPGFTLALAGAVPFASLDSGPSVAAVKPIVTPAAADRVAAPSSIPAGLAASVPAAASSPAALPAALERDVVPGGQPIVISYAPAASGDVRLIDDRGTVRAEALMSREGNSILIAPSVDVAQDFRVILNSGDGPGRAVSALPVRIVPDPGSTAPATVEEVATAAKTGHPFVLDQRTVVAGDSLHLTIVRHEVAMKVTMLDQDGNPVASEPIDPLKTHVALKIPRGMFPEMYTVDVSYVDDNGEEHSVTPVLVR